MLCSEYLKVKIKVLSGLFSPKGLRKNSFPGSLTMSPAGVQCLGTLTSLRVPISLLTVRWRWLSASSSPCLAPDHYLPSSRQAIIAHNLLTFKTSLILSVRFSFVVSLLSQPRNFSVCKGCGIRLSMPRKISMISHLRYRNISFLQNPFDNKFRGSGIRNTTVGQGGHCSIQHSVP